MNPFHLTADALQEPWRLWTCHLAHHDWRHAVDNLLALAIPFILARRRDRARLALWLFVLAPLLSLALMPYLDGGSACGISGLACAAWALVGLQLSVREDSFAVGGLMLGLLALKFGVESFTGCGVLQHGGRWQTLSKSHLFGTLLGLWAGLADKRFAILERRSFVFLRDHAKALITVPR